MDNDRGLDSRRHEKRVLLVPPTSRDAEAIRKVLAREQIDCAVCPTIRALCSLLREGAGAVIVSEEALQADLDDLSACLAAQPVWSDLPVIILSRARSDQMQESETAAKLGNVNVLERPVRTTTLVSVVRFALRARERQYQVRDHLAARGAAEAALGQSREQLELVVRGANVGVWLSPLPLDRLIWDETVKSHFHLPKDAEVTIDTFYERLHPADRERVAAALDAAIKRQQPFELDYRTISPGGTAVKSIRAIGSVSRDAAGNPVGLSGITLDVTQRARDQEELRASEERLRLALGTGRLGIWEVDFATRTMTCSDTCKANFGRSPEMPFSYEDFRESIHPEDQPRVQAAIEATRAGQHEFDLEYRCFWPNNTVHWVLARGRRTYAPHSLEDRLVGVTLDITERKTAEERRAALLEAERAARAEVERTARMKDEFLATLSHELRTPLNAILGWAQLLKSPSPTSESVAEGIAVIERNARAQAQIIEDLLDMSRIISGKVRLDVQRVDLAAVVRAAVDTVQPAASAKEIRILTVLDPLKGPISGDPNRLQQVFWNLISNAVKFTPKGGQVQVVLRRVESQLEVSIVDNGDGIDPVFLPWIFDRFRQADASASRAHGGLGLGLAIVKQLVELHGGTVRAESGGKGKGSAFFVTLPTAILQSSPETFPPQRRPEAVKSSISLQPPLQIEGLTVVVVDDEPDARTLLRRVLEDFRVSVHTAESAARAIELVQSEHPQILISDIGMPGEDGYSLIRQIRALPPECGGNVPAVALTAYARGEDRINAFVAGYQHHLSKPVDAAELIAVVASLAGRHG